MSSQQDFVMENGVLVKYSGPGGEVEIPDGVTEIGRIAFYYCTGLTQITIPEGVTKIGDGAFGDCTGLTQVSIPESVADIGERAFGGCTSLTQVTIPEGVTKISNQAFQGCTSLTQVTIPEGVTKIGNQAFRDCTGLTQVTIPNGVTKISYEAFEGCRGLTQVIIPESITSIGWGVFWNCISLASITIPKQVSFQGQDGQYNVFVSCAKLKDFRVAEDNPYLTAQDGVLYNKDQTELIAWPGAEGSVEIPSTVQKLGKRAFCRCTDLTQVVIPESVADIGAGAFADCTGLTNVNLPDGLASIGREAFVHCTSLTRVVIPADVKEIDGGTFFEDGTFSGCTALREIILLGKTEIKKEAFPDSGLSIVAEQLLMSEFPLPAYKQAAAKGFAQRYAAGAGLPEEYRADCLKYIKSQKKKLYPIALEFTPLLHVMLAEKMVPKGDFTELMNQASAHGNAEASAMLLDYQNKQFKQGELQKLSERKMQQEMDFLMTDVLTATEAKKVWKYEKDEKGNLCILGYKGKETEVVVPAVIGKAKVTRIGSYAFYGCAGLTSVTLPEGLTKIGDFAFRRCTGLASITIPKRVASIGESAFQYCESLTSITIPKRVTNIGKNAFQSCPNLTIHVPACSYAEQYAKENNIPFQVL